MNTTEAKPYDWAESIEKALLDISEIPLVGNAGAFPWEELAKQLASLFEIDELEISPGEMKILAEKELFRGLGEVKEATKFELSPLPGELSLITGEKNRSKLMCLMLNQESKVVDLLEDKMKREFYRFLTAQAMSIFSSLDFASDMSPHLNENSSLPDGDALCLDISLKKGKDTIPFRLVIPEEFRKAFVKHFAPKKPSKLSDEIASQLEVTLPIEAGTANLTLDQWEKVSVGDFILLDSCSLDPDDMSKSHFTITLEGKPIFRTRLKKEGLKILEHPL